MTRLVMGACAASNDSCCGGSVVISLYGDCMVARRIIPVLSIVVCVSRAQLTGYCCTSSVDSNAI
jgi:hypothetical protein